MLDQVLDAFHIKPDFDLNIMKERQTLAEITSNALVKLDELFKDIKPDIVLVHGDTTTTFAGSLAAFYHQIAVGHVEAGLRTGNKYSPFPEELNRQMTGAIADLHFAPTGQAERQFIKRKQKADSIFVTGNTAIDALNTTVRDGYSHPVLEQVGEDKMILLTAHRRENLGEPMENMFKAIRRIVGEFEDVQVVYPVHLNPVVREAAQKHFGDSDRVHLIEPLEVIDFHNFAAKSHFILTDSGGVQEEAPSLGKPVLVLRDTTERPEGVEAGTLKLAGTDEENIYQLAKQLLTDHDEYKKMSHVSIRMEMERLLAGLWKNCCFITGIGKNNRIHLQANKKEALHIVRSFFFVLLFEAFLQLFCNIGKGAFISLVVVNSIDFRACTF